MADPLAHATEQAYSGPSLTEAPAARPEPDRPRVSSAPAAQDPQDTRIAQETKSPESRPARAPREGVAGANATARAERPAPEAIKPVGESARPSSASPTAAAIPETGGAATRSAEPASNAAAGAVKAVGPTASGPGSGSASGFAWLGAQARAARAQIGGAQPAPTKPPILRGEQPEIAPQVAKGLATLLGRGGGSVQISLNPESLGRVRVDLNIHEGVVSARIEAEQEQARELLNQNLDRLRAMLEQRGLRVEKLEIASSAGERDAQTDADERPGGWRMPAQDSPGGGGREAADGRSPWNGDQGRAWAGMPDRRAEPRRPGGELDPAEPGWMPMSGPMDPLPLRSAGAVSIRLDTVA